MWKLFLLTPSTSQNYVYGDMGLYFRASGVCVCVCVCKTIPFESPR